MKQPTSRRRTAPPASDNTREKLLAAAIEQFGEHGFNGASIRDIARAAHTNIALVSYHFGGKEQLYHELLRGFFTHTTQSAFNAAAKTFPQQHLLTDNITPSEAREILKDILGRLASSILSNPDLHHLARIIIREQTRPTTAFDTIYKNGMEKLHKTITRLFALATGRTPETQENIIRAHMLIGQLFSFVFANAAICRRLGKKSIDTRVLSKITTILNENIDALTQPARISRL